jgi:hypothetical protein
MFLKVAHGSKRPFFQQIRDDPVPISVAQPGSSSHASSCTDDEI